VKWLGEGVMFYFREPAAAVLAALEMVEVVGRQRLPPAHVGIHAGPSSSRTATTLAGR
jgi:adenylate cyclase